jgi:mannitol 2-dehydrogenase
MAYVGQLAGFTYVHEACADPRLAGFLRAYMQREAVPTLAVPDGFDLAAYIDQLFERFGNAQVADPLARLSVDSSNRIPKFLLPVVADRVAAGWPSPVSAAVIATWRAFCRAAGEGRFTLDDAAAVTLVAAASGEPGDFLAGVPTLVPLARDPGFVKEFRRAAEHLERDGALALLDGTMQS